MTPIFLPTDCENFTSPYHIAEMTMDGGNLYFFAETEREIRRVNGADIRNLEEPLDLSNTTVVVPNDATNYFSTVETRGGDVFYTARIDESRYGHRNIIRKKQVSGEDQIVAGGGTTIPEAVGESVRASEAYLLGLNDLSFNKCGNLYFSVNDPSFGNKIYRYSTKAGGLLTLVLNLSGPGSAPVYFTFDQRDNIYAITCNSSSDVWGTGPCNIVKFSPAE